MPQTQARGERGHNSHRRALAIVVAGMFALSLVSFATAGELTWQSPTKKTDASQTDGVWSKAKSSFGKSVSRKELALGKANRLRDENVSPIAHHEPAAIDGPSFTNDSTLSNSGSDGVRPMRSVLVQRPAADAKSADAKSADAKSADAKSGASSIGDERPSHGKIPAAEGLAADHSANWRSAPDSRVSRRHRRVSRRQPRDPFEEDSPTPASPSASTLTGTTQETAQILPEAEPLDTTEPRPLDTQSAAEDDARAAPDPFDRASSQPTPPADAEPLATEPLDLRDSDDSDYTDDFDYSEERQRADEDCAEKLRLLKEHTLRPWRDTSKEGWDQRTGDEIRDLLNIQMVGTEGDDYPFECELRGGVYEPRMWAGITYLWKASAMCNKPLYFEDVHLERYGHSWGPFAQPLISGAHFFASIPILPYNMGLKMPNECVYSLGHYRPGNCAPYLLDPIPFTWRAAVLEAGAVVGAAAVLP